MRGYVHNNPSSYHPGKGLLRPALGLGLAHSN